MRTVFVIFLSLLLYKASAQAPESWLKVGDIAPHFQGVDQDGDG